METWLIIVLSLSVVLLLILSSFFSFSEMALSSLKPIKLTHYLKYGTKTEKKRAKRVIKLTKNYNRTIISIVVLNNIVNVLSSVVSTILFNNLFPNDPVIGAVVSFFTMTLTIIIVGELIPKMLARKHSETGSMFVSLTVSATNVVLKPISFVLMKIVKQKSEPLLKSDLEINEALRESQKEGLIDDDERKLVKNVLMLDNIVAKKVMIPKEKVVSLRKLKNDSDLEKLDKIISNKKHTRIPVIDSKNNVVGIYNIKHLLINRLTNKKTKVEDIRLFDVSYFHINDKLDDIFKELKTKRQHMGIVVSNKGTKKMIGIITIEDIIEEIVGDLYDETDLSDEGIYSLSEEKILIEPKTKLNKAIEFLPLLKSEVNEKDISFQTWLFEKYNIKKLIVGESYEYKKYIFWVIIDHNSKNNLPIIEVDILNT